MTKLKKPIILITYGLLLYFILLNFNMITSFSNNLFALVSPFIWGFALAYLINIPYDFILRRLLKGRETDSNFARKKGLAIFLSYVLFLLLIIFSFVLLIPQLIDSVNEFIGNFSSYSSSLEALTNNFINKIQLNTTFLSDLQGTLMSYKDQILQLINNILPSIINLATGTASSIFNTIFTLILSVYFLVSKEKLILLIQDSAAALAKSKTLAYLNHVVDMSNETFRGFIVGQLTDALIVGIITFIGSGLFGFPYPMLIGFIAGITNIIPVVGPFIGAVPCFFIILMAAPGKAIWYLIFVVVLQQIDGNFICPKIVGDSIGLDGIWVIFAVIVGGGLFGIVGSFLCVPVFAILFKLYHEWVQKRLSCKHLESSELNPSK